MTHPFHGAMAAALMAATPLAAFAQPAAAPAPSASSPEPAPKAAPAPTVSHRSAFHGYRNFGDQKVLPWREANDTVGRIGGWQAYARESAAAVEPASAPSGDHSLHKKP